MKDGKAGNPGLSNIIYGVPQDSIIGSLLFIIFVNDLCHTPESLKSIMFSDDTNFLQK